MVDQQRAEYLERLAQCLSQHPLFNDLGPELLTEFINQAEFVGYEQGQTVITQNDVGRAFYVVLSGELRAVETSSESPRVLNYHLPSDIVGTRALLNKNRPRAATVEAVLEVRLAVFHQASWSWLLEKQPSMMTYFHNIEKGYDRTANEQFSQQEVDEVAQISVKRHWLALASRAVPMVGLLCIPLVYLLVALSMQEGVLGEYLLHPYALLGVTIPLTVAGVLGLLYHYLDWRNDDFIVTSKRVIHIERVIFFGEERHEAPLTHVQNVAVKSEGILSHFFDVQDVEVLTAGAGVIRLTGIPNGEAVKEAILNQRQQASERQRATEEAMIRQSLARRLDLSPDAVDRPHSVASQNTAATPSRRLPMFDYLLPRLTSVEVDSTGETITWRQHYGIWLKTIWLSALMTLGSAVFLLALFGSNVPFDTVGIAIRIIGLIGVIGGGTWYLWAYENWYRDLYQVTPDRIVDVDSSTLRTQGEVRREARFEKIQNVTYQIPGFVSKLFNVGHVVIETASSQEPFTFHNVYNPSRVQREIFQRMLRAQQKQKTLERETNTNQFLEMLGQYHQLNERRRAG